MQTTAAHHEIQAQDDHNLNSSFFRNAALSLALLAGAIAGCGPESNVNMKTHDPEKKVDLTNERFEINRVGVFNDDLAYDGQRGIYEIKDKETGKEYLESVV